MKNTAAKEAASRLESMLVRDKVQAPDGFTDVLRADLLRLLGDYFELSDSVSVDIKLSEAADFDISITTKAHRIKAFHCAK